MHDDPWANQASALIATIVLITLAPEGGVSGSPILQSDDAATSSVQAAVATSPQIDSVDSGSYPFYRPVTSGLMSLYQDFISPARGTSCPMHPHCSEYASQVFGNYNTLQAYVMTADRLLRCGHDNNRYKSGSRSAA
jgi:hypothetical protein